MTDPDIERAIADAAQANMPAARARLLERLRGKEVFFNLSPGEEMRTPLVAVGPGLRALPLFSSREHPRLRQEKFGGMPWERALEMVARMPDAQGLVLSNLEDRWVAMDKPHILARLGEAAPPEEGAPSDVPVSRTELRRRASGTN
ncbi:MAG TPA: SseB family protein [Burkholderiaceae bacterium]